MYLSVHVILRGLGRALWARRVRLAVWGLGIGDRLTIRLLGLTIRLGLTVRMLSGNRRVRWCRPVTVVTGRRTTLLLPIRVMDRVDVRVSRHPAAIA